MIAARDFFFQDGSGKIKYGRGDILVVRQEDGLGEIDPQWGGSEAPPDWVRLRITGADKPEAEAWLDNWSNGLDYAILVSNNNGWRISVTIDPVLISSSGSNSDL